MARPDADEVNTLGNGRLFLQWCGPSPNNDTKYAGYNTQYLALEGVTKPVRGGVNPIRVPNPVRPKATKVVGYTQDAPDFITATLRVTEKHQGIPFQWGPLDQPLNIYVTRGVCERLDDINNWSDFAEIYSFARVTDGDFGARTPTWDNDDMLDDSLSLSIFSAYAIGPMSFGYKGSSETNTEVIDVVYGNSRGCADCGIFDPIGNKRWYAVTKSSGAGSPGLTAEVIYTPNGNDIYQKSIDNMGVTEDPKAIALIGNYLVVLGDGAYYYATVGKRTGLVGTFTKVSTGFNASNKPNDMFVANPREIYFAANNGWVYMATSIPQGVSAIEQGNVTTQHLQRIYAQDDQILAVGNSGTIIFSENRGASFAASPVSPTGFTYLCGELMGPGQWFVGSGVGDGRCFYTDNFGNSWTQIVLPGSAAVYDIVAPSLEVIHIAYATATPAARIMSTFDGGDSWVVSSDDTQKRILNLPTFARASRLAFPDVDDLTVASNNLLVAGLASGSTDGLIVLGSSSLH